MAAETGYKSRHALIRDLRKSGVFDADTINRVEKMKPAEARAWFADNVELDGMTGPDIEALWTKKVTISVAADAGEEVEVQTPEASAEPEMEESADPEPTPKARGNKAADVAVGKRVARATSEASEYGKPIGQHAAEIKRYDRAVAEGKLYKGQKPIVLDGDTAMRLGAWSRLVLAGSKDYANKASDRDIIGKAAVETINAYGGALVPEDFQATLIDTKNEFGAYRRACGVTTMARDTLMMPRIDSDVTAAWVGEGSSITENALPTFSNVQLVARKAGVLRYASAELLNDSAISFANVFATSVGRAFGEFEDDSAILGQNNTTGINDLLTVGGGAGDVYDAALSSSWADYTLAHIQAWLGLLRDAAWRKGNVSIICSVQFYHAVLLRFAQSAGGLMAGDILNGVGGRFRQNALAGADAQFDGIPVFFTASAPTSYSGNQIAAWAGAFDLGCKFGEVSGSNQIATSEHVGFVSDTIAFRALERIAINNHDVGGSASLVVGLQD